MLNLSGGTPLRYNVNGSDSAHLTIGEGSTTCDMEFDADAMRSLADVASAAAAEMDALYEREEAEREAAEQAVAAEHCVPGRHHLLPLET